APVTHPRRRALARSRPVEGSPGHHRLPPTKCLQKLHMGGTLVRMTNDPRTLLRDAGYVTVGLGVIAFQKAQVRRRELECQLSGAGEKTSEKVEQLTTALED